MQEWDYVVAKAGRNGKKVHVGRVFGICVEKGAELPKGSKCQRYKGRYVYQENYAKDEHGNYAMFQKLNSNPATMEAVKLSNP